MDRRELRKANGDIFFEAERREGNSYILVNWTGIQSLEAIMMGASQILAMLRQRPCPAILNSNKELIGPWDDGAIFLGGSWIKQAKLLGVKYFAHVLAPGIYGQRSFKIFEQAAQQHLPVEAFETDQEAENWLRRKV